MTPSDYILISASVAVLLVGCVLVYRACRTVAPGWKYELRSRGKIVYVLDKPGFYLVSPFLTAKRVRIDGPRRDK